MINVPVFAVYRLYFWICVTRAVDAKPSDVIFQNQLFDWLLLLVKSAGEKQHTMYLQVLAGDKSPRICWDLFDDGRFLTLQKKNEIRTISGGGRREHPICFRLFVVHQTNKRCDRQKKLCGNKPASQSVFMCLLHLSIVGNDPSLH